MCVRERERRERERERESNIATFSLNADKKTCGKWLGLGHLTLSPYFTGEVRAGDSNILGEMSGFESCV